MSSCICQNKNDEDEVEDSREQFLDQADQDHHKTPMAEKIEYFKRKLDLENNPLLKDEDKKNQVIQVLIKNWNCFDINNNRTGKSHPKIKQHIDTGNSAPIKAKCRPLNPIICNSSCSKSNSVFRNF